MIHTYKQIIDILSQTPGVHHTKQVYWDVFVVGNTEIVVNTNGEIFLSKSYLRVGEARNELEEEFLRISQILEKTD